MAKSSNKSAKSILTKKVKDARVKHDKQTKNKPVQKKSNKGKPNPDVNKMHRKKKVTKTSNKNDKQTNLKSNQKQKLSKNKSKKDDQQPEEKSETSSQSESEEKGKTVNDDNSQNNTDKQRFSFLKANWKSISKKMIIPMHEHTILRSSMHLIDEKKTKMWTDVARAMAYIIINYELDKLLRKTYDLFFRNGLPATTEIHIQPNHIQEVLRQYGIYSDFPFLAHKSENLLRQILGCTGINLNIQDNIKTQERIINERIKIESNPELTDAEKKEYLDRFTASLKSLDKIDLVSMSEEKFKLDKNKQEVLQTNTAISSLLKRRRGDSDTKARPNKRPKIK